MTEKIIKSGYWKRADQELNECCSGTLTYDPEIGIRLEILGNLSGIKYHSGILEYEFLHGFTSDGMKITLYKCTGFESFPTPGIASSDFTAEYLFIGSHLTSLDQIKIESSAIRYSYIDEWTNVQGFKNSLTSDTDLFAEAKYKQPESITLYSKERLKIILWFSAKNKPGRFENIISQKVYVNVIYETDYYESFYNFIDIVYKIRNFFGFAISRRSSIKEVKVTCKFEKEYDLEIYFTNPLVTNNETFIPGYSMLFSYENVKEKIQEVFSKWLYSHDKLSAVFKLYFDTYYNIELDEQNKFLNLIFAVENYHRKIKNSTHYTDHYIIKLKEKIIKSVEDEGEEIQEFVKKKINFINEPSLRDRLSDIFSDIKTIVELIEKDIITFQDRVVSTRNYLAHNNPDLINKIIKANEYYLYNKSLLIILEACFLKQLGFTDVEIEDSVKRSVISWSKLNK